MNLSNLSPQQLRKAATLKEQIVTLHKQLAAILGSTGISAPMTAAKPVKGTISAAHIAKIRAAQKLRWAKVKAAKAQPAKRTISAAGIARIKAAQRARWAAIKAKAAPNVVVAPKPVVKVSVKPAVKKGRNLSPEARAKMAAAAKAMWARIRAEKAKKK